MRQRFFLWLLLGMTLTSAWAQQQNAAVTATPNPFSEDQSITLRFTGVNLTTWGVNDAYLWAWSLNSAGVSQDAPNNGSWTSSSEAHKLTKNTDGSLSITFIPKDFYGRTNISRIGFLVKAKDGSGDKKTQDLFLDVGTFDVVLTSPTASLTLLENGASLQVTATSTLPVVFTLKADGTLIHTSTATTSYSYAAPVSQLTSFALRATAGGEFKEYTFEARPKPAVVQAPVPDGWVDGINFDPAQPDRVKLVFYAPQKQVVHVIGPFNQWAPSESYMMKYDANSSRFWIELDGLTPDSHLLYQYLVDFQIRVADPYATQILDPWNDSYISSDTYAGIPAYPANAYPEGETPQAITWVTLDTTPYVWNDAGYQRPAKEDLVIYELLLRDFDPAHSYAALQARLDYLQSLGVNAIELMPINEFDGNESWGYNPSFHMAVDKYYGSPDALKALVDACHQRGIAVIADIVFNHATGQNPYFRMYNDSQGANSGTPSADSPFFNVSAKHAYSVFYDFNHHHPSQAARSYVKRVVQEWIRTYKLDGFRWDLTKGFTQNCGQNDEYCTGVKQDDRVEVLKAYADFQWAVDGDSYVIFEHLGNNDEESIWANYRLDEGKGIMLWSNYNWAYSQSIQGYSDGANFNGASYLSRGWTEPRNVVYMESHDEERLMFRALEYGNASIKGNLNLSLERAALTASFFWPIPGPKMLWQFGELGYDYSINYEGRLSNKPIRWDYAAVPERAALRQHYADWIGLRKAEPIFNTDDFTISSGSATGVKVIKLSLPDAPEGHASEVMIVGNFGVTTQTAIPVFAQVGVWYDWFDENRRQNIYEASMPMALAPGEWHVYANAPTAYFPNNNPPDQDNDGVVDGVDQCPDTPFGSMVDVQGCPVFSLPRNRFSLKSTAATCPGSSNGALELKALAAPQDYTYTAVLSKEGAVVQTVTLSPTSLTQTITDLPVGTYQVCFSVVGISGYSQCYTASVSEPTPLAAAAKVDVSARTITLNLAGAARYRVSINGVSQEYSSAQVGDGLVLDLAPGNNLLRVETEAACQGVYTDQIFVSAQVLSYPNPTSGPLQVYVAGSDTEVAVQWVTLGGVVLDQDQRSVSDRRVMDWDISAYPSGVYVLTITGTQVRQSLKIVKQ